MGKPVMKKEEFDSIIKQLVQMKDKDALFIYKIVNIYGIEKYYDMYYSNTVFEKFVNDMPSKHKKAFDNGAGGELKPGQYPPKMASVASSSRFCYLALRNGVDITIGNEHISGYPEFEKICVINKSFGTHPHLDAFIPDSQCYFEVKCHEIFDSHKIVMENKYQDLIKKEFGLDPLTTSNTKSGSFELPLKEFGIKDKTSTMFDIKQLICHLLGIANQEGDNKKLVYLFFNPAADKAALKSRSEIENDILVAYNKHFDKIFTELSEEIKAIFNSDPIKTFCNTDNHKIKLMAISEHSVIMEPLTDSNIRVLY